MSAGHIGVLVGEDVGDHELVSEAGVDVLIHFEGRFLDDVVIVARVEDALDADFAHEADTVLTGARVEQGVVDAADSNDVELVVI
jgi:hypothetical protein